MILHIGVVDQPYNGPEGRTTGDVAEILEKKYGIMGVFAEVHGNDIADALADSMAGALDNLLMGAPIGADPFAEGCSNIDTTFRQFLSSHEIAGQGIEGVPTQAALDGVNHRLKIRKGAARPSFIDTGLYQASEKSWIE